MEKDSKIWEKGTLSKTTPNQQKIRDKTITAEKFSEMVKPGDWINFGGIGSDPTVTREAIFQRLGEGLDNLQNIELWQQAMPLGSEYGLTYDREAKYHILHEGFLHKGYRDNIKKGWMGHDWFQWGWAIHINAEYARNFRKEKSKRAIDWGIQAIAKPEGNYVNGSYGVNNFMVTAKTCKKFVCEIREDYAWCEPGRNVNLHIDDVDYFVEVNCNNPKYQWPQMNERGIKASKEEEKIAEHILSVMRDGDCIQVGIGTLPGAVVLALANSSLKHIGIHTEMIGEYAFTLAEKGILDNSRKTIDTGRCSWAYATPFDIERYYEWMHHNPFFAAYDINYTNNFLTLASINNMLCINNFAQIDIRGQICSGNVGGRPISSTGGQFQFIVGGSMSKGGRAILAATSKAPDGRSRIVSMLDKGSVVDVPAQFVTYVATEYGIVNLMACTDAERAKKLISIAHPDDRYQLERESAAMDIKINHWMFTICPDRRYPTTDDLKEHKYGYMDPLVIPNVISKIND